MTELYMGHVETPIGVLLLAWHGDTVCSLWFDDREDRMAAALKGRFGEVRLTHAPDAGDFRRALDDYFAGDIAVIDRIAVDTGGTAFQQSVWRLLRLIPAGTTTTYGELAAKLNSPGASRAVGLANGQNPVSIIVPCHRVIGASGKLVGYGGGLDRKRWLLAHESGQRVR